MKSLDIKTLIKGIINGTEMIANEFEYINELNVFPVPDGDTGTNLKITTRSAIDSTLAKLSQPTTLFEFGSIYPRQLLINARGNSGVIFSQIIRGFFEPINEKIEKISPEQFFICLKAAKEKAYKSVTNPVEGTILSIIRLSVENLENKKFNDIDSFLKELLSESLKALKKTPDMLVSLKEAGVVDSGGYGLCKFFEGLYLSVINKNVSEEKKDILDSKNEILNISNKVHFIQNKVRSEINEEGFGYCCEFIIKLDFKTYEDQKPKLKWDKKQFEEKVLSFGDSIVIVEDNDIVKLHMHSVEPYKFLQVGQKYGEFLKIKIDNMTSQYLDNNPNIDVKNLFKKVKLDEKCKIIATVPSEKIGEYFINNLNVDFVMNTESGNPSTNEIINKIKLTNSKNIIFITDDPNIIMSAKNASELVSDKYNVEIVEGRNIIESLFASMIFDKNKDLMMNYKLTSKSIKKTYSGMISTSIKSCKFKDVSVQKGDYIGIIGKEIIFSDKNQISVVYELIRRLAKNLMTNKKKKNIYIIYGKDVTIRSIRDIEKFINENYGAKVIAIDGQQNIYNYFIGVEQ